MADLELEVRLQGPARRDLSEIQRWSLEQFGADAAYRYRLFLQAGLHAIGSDSETTGSQERTDLGVGVRGYHLRFSREEARSALGIVKDPRHFIVYRRRQSFVEVLRILHDSRDLARHSRSGRR